MAKFKLNTTQIIGIVCLLLMVALIVVHFMPFWSVSDDITLSIGQYTAFPTEKAYNKTFIKDIKEQLVSTGLMDASEEGLKKLAINDFIYPSALVMLLSIFGFVFCPFKLGKPLGIAFNLAIGIIGAYMYLHHPIYQLNSIWLAGLGISIALAVLALVNAVLYIVKKINN